MSCPTTGSQAAGCFGQSVSANDINGDGFIDVIVGAPKTDFAFIGSDEGAAHVYFGNDTADGGDSGLDRIPRQWRTDGLGPIALLGRSDQEDSFRLKVTGRTAAGRGTVRLEWQATPFGVPFGGVVFAGPWTNTGGWVSGEGSRISLDQLVNAGAEDQLLHWRLRTVSDSPFFPRSPWFSQQGNSPTEADLRMDADTCQVAFSTFGIGLPGSGAYVPTLTGTGSSCSPGGHAIHITQGLGRANAQLWAGIGQADLPFFGGHFYINFGLPWIMVPMKLLGTPGVPGAGYLDIPGADVHAYTGLTLYMQVSVVDPGAIHGVALTNGLRMTITD